MQLFSDEFLVLWRQICFFLYNSVGLFSALYILIEVTPHLKQDDSEIGNIYAKPDGQLREVFRATEMLPIVEVIFHLRQLQKMKRHIFLQSLWAVFITFCVVPYYSTHYWVICWVFLRSARKFLRYFHRLYLEAGFRHEVYSIEWICITGLTWSFPLEYLTSVVIVLVTFPVARLSNSMHMQVGQAFSIDLSLSYLVLLFLSVPYFLSTLVYLCTKRTYQLTIKKEVQRKKKVAASHKARTSDDEEDSE